MTPQPLSRRHALGAAAGVGVALPTLAACGGDASPPTSTTTASDDESGGAEPSSEQGTLTTVGTSPSAAE